MRRVVEAVTTNDVSISSTGFDPRTVEVRVRVPVRWRNDDMEPHTVSSAEIESGEIAPGGTFSYAFQRPGRYRYFCMAHPRTVGEVHVRGS